MKKKHNVFLTTLVVLLCIILVGGAGFLLWRALPKGQPEDVSTLETGTVFSGNGATVEPEREEPYEGELPEAAAADTPAVQPTAQAETTETDDAATAQAKSLLATMTLEEKLWQMFFVTPEAITGVDTATVAGDATKTALEEIPVGGLVYFAKNLEDREQTRNMLSNSQSYVKIPLFLGVDEEGGTVSRLGSNPEMGITAVDSMANYGKTGDPAAVYAVGTTLGAELLKLGFNVDFAPVADVAEASSAVIGSRSFGSDPNLCASLVSVMVKGLQASNVASCLKHFPGYGSATGDDHNGAAKITKTLEQLETADFLPFQSGIDAGAAFAMVTHLSVPAVIGDDTPSDLSSKIVTELLRNKLGFENVIITDSQQMASITDHYTSAEAAVAAVQAGVDMVLMPNDLQQAYDGLLAAVKDGTITQARIDESVLRILRVKYQFGILTGAAS